MPRLLAYMLMAADLVVLTSPVSWLAQDLALGSFLLLATTELWKMVEEFLGWLSGR